MHAILSKNSEALKIKTMCFDFVTKKTYYPLVNLLIIYHTEIHYALKYSHDLSPSFSVITNSFIRILLHMIASEQRLTTSDYCTCSLRPDSWPI